jgi:PAS domain S-box-containing protein
MISIIERIGNFLFGNRKSPAIQQSEDLGSEKYHMLLESAPDAFVQIDSKGRIINVNNKTIELSGYTRSELLSMAAADLFPQDVLKDKPLRFDLLNAGQTIKNEREIRVKSGKRIQVETNTNSMPDGTYQSFIRDISDRKKSEEAIRVSEARLKRAELVSKSGNWELHLDNQMMIASEGATKIYGVDKDQMEYSLIKKVPLPEYRTALDKALKELIEEDKPYNIEFKIKAVDTGEIKDIRSIAIFDKEKRILFGAIQDITHQKKIEQELINAKEKAEESDRLKTAFLQNLSHEIRTPMNAIMGFSELMTEEFDHKDKLEKYSKIINRRCNDLLGIINDILDIAKIESGQLSVNPEACKISFLFEEIKTLFTEFQSRMSKEHIEFDLRCNLNSSEDIILTDKIKLKQILINLISNAFKFTQKGKIIVTCKRVDKSKLLFSVKDTGIGIPQEKHAAVFDRFVQLDQTDTAPIGGNGLGLSIVKGLVNLLGGEVFLESKSGLGSNFSFTLPYKFIQPAARDNLKPEKVAEISLSDKLILIVEDDIYNMEYLKDIIAREGINILHALNAKEAIEISIKNPVDLVLMDIRLPDMSGYEATRQIREHKPDLKIIAQTAYASHDERLKAMMAGCTDYISKPTSKYSLIAMMYKHLVEDL